MDYSTSFPARICCCQTKAKKFQKNEKKVKKGKKTLDKRKKGVYIKNIVSNDYEMWQVSSVGRAGD